MFVFVVDEDERVRRVDVVTVGEERDGQIEIKSGLQGGERCVVQPPDELAVGDLVKASE
jgi:multidrug efflux pump subunit AcrA (membrane-fusion protein)